MSKKPQCEQKVKHSVEKKIQRIRSTRLSKTCIQKNKREERCQKYVKNNEVEEYGPKKMSKKNNVS